MKKLRIISKKFYLRQIATCWLAVWMLFGLPVQVARANPAPTAGTLPSGHTEPYGGVGGFTYDFTPGAERLDITGVTNGAVINWDNFDIGAGATTEFQQTSSAAWALNRVNATDSMATGISGSLLANGNIIVVNPRGIVSAPGSYIKANNAVLSGLRMDDGDFGDFTSGSTDNLNFYTQLGDIGSVTNAGTIEALQGVYLVAKNITNAAAGQQRYCSGCDGRPGQPCC
ncbi:MAG: filamentous hemagglutinin N-terminal domain-containing protein [Planctomycetota bacterium]|jgi:filamentous hemagglutinin family protein